MQHDALWVDQIDRAELFRRLRYIEPNKSFRETVQYSNTIFTIIGYIAERLTGESWDELIKTRIFQPLGMTRSNTSVDEFAGIDDVAVPYWNFHGDVRRIRNWNVDLGAPCAGVNACVEDMSKDDMLWGCHPYGAYYLDEYQPGAYAILKANPGYVTYNPNVENKKASLSRRSRSTLLARTSHLLKASRRVPMTC